MMIALTRINILGGPDAEYLINTADIVWITEAEGRTEVRVRGMSSAWLVRESYQELKARFATTVVYVRDSPVEQA